MALLVLGGVLGCAGGLGGYFFIPTRVMPSNHMRPSHPEGGSMVFNLLVAGVDRGDVVFFDAAAWGERFLAVERVVAVGGTVPLSAVKGALIDEDDPLVAGLRSAVPVGGGLLFLGAVSGVAALRLRRRAVTAAAPTADTAPVPGV
ncbi:hypothetical protein [Streptomyces sp. DSM 40907]|uniref:hypothetical protein n=1 Tax=Streptomyces kutzneri TaxID=3051179 RepID=UPI0028D489DE|nr:hypothetical protein [Streptomyces sp. DSM 40907]